MFQQSFTKSTALPYYLYDQRGLLRNWSPQDGAQALVDGLGMFVYSNSNSQTLDGNNVNTYQAMDDDESCFLTGNGAWLLEYPHWDLVNNWQLPDIEALYLSTYANGQPKFYNNTASGRTGFYLASVPSAIVSISAASVVVQTITVNGANVGDQVFVTSSSRNYVVVSYSAAITATNTIVVSASNASASLQNLSAGNWNLLIVKSS